MYFDVKTLMFFMALSGLLMAGAITLADAQERGGLNGLRVWTLALLVQAGGWLVLVASNSLIPSGFAGPLALAGVSLCWGLRVEALSRCAGRSGPRWLSPALVATSLAISIGSPASEWLVGLHTLLYGLISGVCAGLVRRLPVHGHPLMLRIVAVAFGLVALVLAARAVELLLARRLWGQAEIWRTPLEQAAFLGGYALTIIVTVSLILLHRAGQEQQLRQLAGTDALTGLLNRRSFLASAASVLEAGVPVAALMLDLDHFKAINDRYGHPVGDAVLREVAATLAGGLRRDDLLARFGGEEFAVLLPHTGAQTALAVAERLRSAVATQRSGPGELHYTISIGIATATGDAALDVLISEADRALYVAKREGRNRCVLTAVPEMIDGHRDATDARPDADRLQADGGNTSAQAARLP